MLGSIETIKTINSFVKQETPFFFVIDFEKENNLVLPKDQCSSQQIYYSIPGERNFQYPNLLPILTTFEKTPVSFKEYEEAFKKVISEIQTGNSYLLNLTFPTPVSTNLSLYELFLASEAPFKLFFKNEFVLFSPERFISIANGVIKTFPMKGTIKANSPKAQVTLLNDRKEAAEHATIVDLLRNDLSMVAQNVKVNRYRYLELIDTNFGAIFQASTEIEGVLTNDYENSLGELLFSLLPAGSVTGAPKDKTVEIIKLVEMKPRGFYTGIFGVWDNHKLDTAVMIRFIKQENKKLVFQSGGGVTFQSDCLSEYNELIDKVYAPISRNN